MTAFEYPNSQNFDFIMAIVKLKIDVSGTVGDEAWQHLRQFDEIQSAAFGPRFGSSGVCKHAAELRHAKAEWIGAEITLETPLLAQYAVSHYLEQDRVLDADVVEQDTQT
jgi:hypothetical protein